MHADPRRTRTQARAGSASSQPAPGAAAPDWSRPGVEPLVTDVLADPIIRLVMRRDGVTARDLRALVERLWHEHHRQAARAVARCGAGATLGEVADEPLSSLR